MTYADARFVVLTEDGIRIAGERIEGPPSFAFVVGHGFCGSSHNVRPLAIQLSNRGKVYAFDFRGHGASTGSTTLGALEPADIRAVVALVRSECAPTTRIITVGASMGAIAVLREAATSRTSDAVVSISCPAEWLGQAVRARLLGMLVTSRLGRAMAQRFFSTTVEPEWLSPAQPVDLVRSIKVPILFIHGADDPFVRPAQAKLLYAAAGRRAWLRVIGGYGHAESGFDERVVKRIDEQIETLIKDADEHPSRRRRSVAAARRRA
jgi:pimeloyl-ACP methyl ester carboxylesterase